MTTTEQRRTLVIQQIRDAFAGVGREGGISFHEADAIDGYGSDQMRAEARALDTEDRWEDVPAADTEYYWAILCFVDPIGFRYYLPAYMVWTLEHDGRSRSASVESAIYHLGRSDKEPDYAIEYYALFDPEQCRAICAFLRFMADDAAAMADENAARALESYWGRFCE